MIRNMPISSARNRLTSLHSELEESRDTIAVTSRGKAVLALLNWELYESIMETLSIVSEPELMDALKQSIKEAEAGETLSLEELEW